MYILVVRLALFVPESEDNLHPMRSPVNAVAKPIEY